MAFCSLGVLSVLVVAGAWSIAFWETKRQTNVNILLLQIKRSGLAIGLSQKKTLFSMCDWECGWLGEGV